MFPFLRALPRELKQMSPANRQDLHPTVSRPGAELGIQSFQVGRVGIYGLDGLAKDVHVVDEIDALHSEAVSNTLLSFHNLYLPESEALANSVCYENQMLNLAALRLANLSVVVVLNLLLVTFSNFFLCFGRALLALQERRKLSLK